MENTTPKKEPVILIIEDEEPLVKVIQEKLRRMNIANVSARSVDQAIEYLGSIEGISAVWLDHYLYGEKTGLDLVKTMKEQPRWSKIPVFVVTNTASPEKNHHYEKMGVAKYYIKANVPLDEIIGKIVEVIG